MEKAAGNMYATLILGQIYTSDKLRSSISVLNNSYRIKFERTTQIRKILSQTLYCLTLTR